MTEYKVCSQCGKEKPLSEFNRDYDGYRPECRQCSRKTWQAYYRCNKRKERARKAAWYQKNRERLVKKQRERRRAAREEENGT